VNRASSSLARRGFRLALIAAVTFFCLLPICWTAAQAQVPAADTRCLGCHARRGLFKSMENSDHMSMVVPADAYAKSVHATTLCTDCHTDVKAATHLETRKSIKSARAYAIASGAVCQNCHDKESREWRSSIHAALVTAGNDKGPICTNCHPPHTETPGMSRSIENLPCKSCHDTIFAGYAGSVHATARKDDKAAPVLCSGCHNAHDVSIASSPTGPKHACLSCHDGVLQKHQAWLPNASLHFEMVSCPVCHSPTAARRVDLQLVEGTERTRHSEKAGVPTFNTPGKSVDAIALYNLLQTTAQQTPNLHAALRGRLEVSTPEQIHQLAPKEQAISRCDTCHSAGAAAFQSVSISVAGPDGLPIRYVVDKEVLSSAMSLGAISGFYAIGGTRIGVLDTLLLLAVLAGVGVPAAHLLLGVLVRRHRKRRGMTPGPQRID